MEASQPLVQSLSVPCEFEQVIRAAPVLPATQPSWGAMFHVTWVEHKCGRQGEEENKVKANCGLRGRERRGRPAAEGDWGFQRVSCPLGMSGQTASLVERSDLLLSVLTGFSSLSEQRQPPLTSSLCI